MRVFDRFFIFARTRCANCSSLPATRIDPFDKEEERVGVDMVLKDGNLITNVFNRLIRTYFYAIQNNCDGRIPKGEVSEVIKTLAEKAMLDYEHHMYNHEFHRISYVLDDFIRRVNKHWVNNVRIADATGDVEFRKRLISDVIGKLS